MFWNIVIAIASFILNLVLAPKPQNAKPAALEDFNVPTAEEGIEIPVVFGTVHIRNPNCVWYGDFTAQAVKSGPRRYILFGPRQVTGHRYYLGMHLLLCHGVHDEIREIWAGDKKLWPNPFNRFYGDEIRTKPITGIADVFIDQEDIFGGKEKEGGIMGVIHCLTGTPSQGQNAYLVSKLNEPYLPAFRGVVSVIWNHLYIGTGTYLKNWEFTLKRIHKTSAGVTQWYDAKAAVPDSLTGGGAGVQLWPQGTWTGAAPGTTMNDENKIDTAGAYAGRADEYQGTEIAGQLRVWHLPDGAMQTRMRAGFTTTPGALGYAFPHFTQFGEIVVLEGGNIWGSGDVHIIFLNPANINSETQGSINITSYYVGIILNWGAVVGELGNFMLLKIGPTLYTEEPWILLQRSGDQWVVGETHHGVARPNNMGVATISMGPIYAYCQIGMWGTLAIMRVCWNPDYTWEEIIVDMAPLGLTGQIRAVFYWQGTNEVIIITDTSVFVFNSTLTTLNRSRTSWPRPVDPGSGGYGNGFWSTSSKRATVTSTTFMIHYTAYQIDELWEVDAVSLEVVKTTNVFATNWVNNHPSDDTGPMYYNRDMGGLVKGTHFFQPISWWPYAVDGLDMNPAHIIRECLTDKIWGMGYNAADIDDASFTDCADKLYNECFGLSLQWNREEKIEEFITVILSHIDAYLYLRRTTGKFFLKLIRNDYNLASLPVFDEDDVITWADVSRREPAEAVNSVIVKYTNRRGGDTDNMGRGKDSSHSFDNIGQIQQLGERISATRVYPGISRGDLAARVAARDQMSLGIGLISGRVEGKRTMDILYPGDPFRLLSSRHNLDGEIMRVVSMKFGDGRDNKIGLKFAQDVFRLGAPDLIDTSDGDWENPSNPPSAVYPRLVWEAPYWQLQSLIGPTDTATMLAGDANAGMIAVTGGQPTSDAESAVVYVNAIDEGSMDFAPAGTLSTTIGAFDTMIGLDNASNEDLIEIGMLAAIIGDSPVTTEIVRVTAVTGVTLTIARGLIDTIPQPHTAGQSVVVFDDLAMTDFIARNAVATPAVRLLTMTSQGTLAFTVAPEDTVDMNSRAIRPLRPADVKVEGFAAGPVDGVGLTEFDVTWANRNRLTEVGTVLAWDGATATPESGQTTIIEVLDPDAASVVTTHSGLTGTSFAVPMASFDSNPSGWIRVGAERGGYREWQAYRIECFTIDIDILYLDPDALNIDGESLTIS